MSWLFSKALMDSVSLPCLQEPEAESSEATYSDGEPSAQWNVMPTPQGFWRNDKMMDASRLSQFGPTLRLLTEQHGEDVLTSFLAAFPARTYPQPDEARESLEQDQDSGLSSLESLARYDPDTCSWKTPQYSLLGDLVPFSETWPRWGTMRSGACWAQPMWEPRTRGTESGLWPTPNVPNGGRSVAHVTEWSESGRTAYHKGKKVQVGLESAVRLWPTPLANSHTGAGHGPNKKGGMNLQTAVKKWPTPVASMHKGSSPASLTRKSGKSRENDRLDHAVMASNGGALSPMWTEWLMGWPIGWTDLKPLAMARFQEWRQQHSL